MLDGNQEIRPFHDSESAWLRSFSMKDVKCLVVCRGPVRKEAFEIFDRMGLREYGMLLSEKDSVVYPRCRAPELRSLRFPANVHLVADYMGVGQEEKRERIDEIIEIARSHAYTHIFVGYGFMAEDAEFIQAIETAGIGFIGPSSEVVRRAGAKDEAKKLARALGNAVIPGVDDVSARALVAKVGDRAGLAALAREHALDFDWSAEHSREENAEILLQAGYAATVELVTIAELQSKAEQLAREIWSDYPNHRIRFKHIAGGGGKGQRVVGAPEDVAGAILDLLAEVKAAQPGSNRNFLVELNVESTRHNEIQLIGNGSWCISLGGRDCSVQMHEQKLLEVSLTQELLDAELKEAIGRKAEILRGDKETLGRMEEEGARFGEATGLDSVSTFECIVAGFDHFFMEMNTRIQVEHGVTELAYAMKFTHPDDPSESFVIEELIEAMVLLAVHGPRVPKPERIPRAVSGLEVRINATNRALQPHAGGLIRSWTEPSLGEIRWDQGIGTPNPDTGSFIWYKLAGAYDSNIALVLTDGKTRRDNYERMAEALRRMEIRGEDVQTNLSVHYGLVNWFLGKGVMAKPNTGFMQPYLAAVGALQRIVNDIDLELAASELAKAQADDEAREVLAAKQTLLIRPVAALLQDPHQLAGFLGRFDGELWQANADGVRFEANPVRFLDCLYHYLDMQERPGVAPSEKIWEQDLEILSAALAFYAEVESRTGASTFGEIETLFAGKQQPALSEGDTALWQACEAAHRGFQVGLELLLLIPRIGQHSQFLDISVDESLVPSFPERFLDADESALCTRALSPPPRASADEIVTPMGGTFFAREAPHLPMLVGEGEHFEEGQPLFIIEVMKMFNKVLAPFAGTVTVNLMAELDATVVAKGQTIFKIEPDERIVEEPPEAVAARTRASTLSLLALQG